jgi:hypothetical protein
MKRATLISLALLSVTIAFADNHIVSSPDGKLKVDINDDGGQATYAVNYNGTEILSRSALGLSANYADFTKNLKIVKAKESKVSKSYDMTRIKKSHVEYKANQITLDLVNADNLPMQITFNVSDNDIAFRYSLPRPKQDNPKAAIIYKEVSGFNFPSQTRTFLSPQITPMTGWERTKPSYEEEYRPDSS